MYRIFAYNPDGSQYTIYDPVYAGALPVVGPRSSEEVNEAGTLEFTLLHGHSAYGFLQPKMTYISAYLGNQEFFYGRLVNNEPTPIEGQVRYSVAGALSFLKDSEVPPDPRKKDGSGDYQTMTAEAFFARCIAAHNADIGNDSRRTFSVGIVRHSRKSERREYRLDSYQDTMSVIESNILNYYGGFIRVRRDPQNGLVLDWIEDQYGDTDAAVLSLGQNIISLTNRANGEELITTIRPIGAGGILMEGEQTIDLFPNSEMASYGKIVRSVTFSDATTAAELRTKAQNYVSKLQKTILLSSDIKLLDMRFVDGNAHGVNLGDTFTHVEGMNGIPLMVTTRNRDFDNPQNDSCTLKNKKAYDGTNSLLGRDGGSISKRTSRNSAANGVNYKYIHEYDNRLKLMANEIEIDGEQIEIHAQQLVETAVQFARISHKQGETDTRLGIIEGTGVFQNSAHITQIAGRFQYDQQTGDVTLIDGSELKVHDKNGVTITVGTRLNELGEDTARIQGSALWTQRDNITGVCGEFEVVTGPDGKKTLKIKSGGGIKILRDEAEFGLYDEGNLTGGVMVDKLNDGTVVTKIRGDKIDLSTNAGYTQLVADKNGLQTTVSEVQSTVSSQGVTISSMTGSALWTQRDNITGVCGEFDVVTLPDGSKYLRIKSGGGIKILRDEAEFGLYDAGNLTGGIMVEKLNDDTVTTTIRGDHVNIESNASFSSISGTVGSITQSALWQTKDNITNVVGEFEVATAPDGTKTLKIKSGGGVKILRDEAEFGLYDAGNLTAGVICEKINNGSGTQTTIKGDRVIIGNLGSLSGDSVETWMQNAYHGQGVFAKFLTVEKLTADTISSKFTSSVWLEVHNLKVKASLLVNYAGVGDVGFGSLVKDVQIVSAGSGTYKLQKKIASSNDWTDVGDSFSFATSLSGSWSGSTFTITATPQNKKYYVKLTNSASTANEMHLDVALNGSVTFDTTNTKLQVPVAIFEKNTSSSYPDTARYSKTLEISQSTLTEGNIKKDVTIFGVKGTYAPVSSVSLSKPSYSSGYAFTPVRDGSAMTSITKYVKLGNSVSTADTIYLNVALNGSITFDTTNTKLQVPVAIFEKNTSSSYPDTARYSKTLEISQSTLTEGNIKKDVTIFGVKGTYAPVSSVSLSKPSYSSGYAFTPVRDGSAMTSITKYVKLGNSVSTTDTIYLNVALNGSVTFDTKNTKLKVPVSIFEKNTSSSNPDTARLNKTLEISQSTLTAENIKKDVTIFGVKGTYSDYNNGWAAAYGKVGLPTAENTTARFVAKGPASTVGEQLTHNYYVTADNDYAYLRFSSTSGTVVARANNPGYVNGWNDATGQLRFQTSVPTTADKNYMDLTYPKSGSGSESVRYWLVDNTAEHRIDMWKGNASGGTDYLVAYKNYTVPSPSYSVGSISGGSAQADAISRVLAGYTQHYISSIGFNASQQNAYRYIKFTVDGHKHAIYFA